MKPTLAGLVGLVFGTVSTYLWMRPTASGTGGDDTVGPITYQDQSPKGGFGKDDTGWSIGDPRIPLRKIEEIASRHALSDPVDAIRAADQIRGHDLREAYLSALFYTWGESKGGEACEWLIGNLSGAKLTDALYFAGDGWAESDPQGAARWLVENTEGAVLEDGMWEALESWGRKDSAKAFEWAKQLDEYTAYGVMDGLAEGWAAVDPAAAGAAAIELIDEPYAYGFLEAVATQWAGQDPEAAIEWAHQVLREDFRAGVLAEIAQQWAGLEPEAAAARILRIDDPGNRRFALAGLAVGWSEHDPAAALRWTVDTVQDTSALREMVDEIVFNWTLADPRGTAEWLRSAETSPGRDISIAAFGDSIYSDDPFSAISWVNEISAPSLRDPLLRKMIEKRYASRGSDALTELEQIDLPDEIVNEFLPGLVGGGSSAAPPDEE